MKSVEKKPAASVPIGDVLTRRRFLAAAGGAAIWTAVPLAGLALPATVLSSQDPSASAQPALIRRSVTRLSSAEKAELVKAILEMKQVRSPFDPSVSYYDQFVRWHLLSRSCPREEHPDTPWPAHASPGFLPWHRLLMLLFERGIYAVTGKRIAVPYWDWTQPGAIDAVFTEDFLGPPRGDARQNYVMTDGPFRKDSFALNVRSAPSEDPGQSRHLVRACGVYANDYHKNLASSLPTAQELTDAMALRVYDVAPFDISTSASRSFRARFEGWDGFKTIACSVDGVDQPIPIPDRSPSLMLHNRVHRFVGGSFKMGDQVWFGSFKTYCSPNDPVFFLHHSFVDKVWADWMARHGQQYLPENPLPRTAGALVAVPGRSTPLVPFDGVAAHIATPGSVLNHHALGYAYDTDSIVG